MGSIQSFFLGRSCQRIDPDDDADEPGPRFTAADDVDVDNPPEQRPQVRQRKSRRYWPERSLTRYRQQEDSEWVVLARQALMDSMREFSRVLPPPTHFVQALQNSEAMTYQPPQISRLARGIVDLTDVPQLSAPPLPAAPPLLASEATSANDQSTTNNESPLAFVFPNPFEIESTADDDQKIASDNKVHSADNSSNNTVDTLMDDDEIIRVRKGTHINRQGRRVRTPKRFTFSDDDIRLSSRNRLIID